MSDLSLLRLFLAAFFTFVAVFYTALILYKKKRYQPVTTMGPTYSCHWWNHLTFRVFRASIWLVCVWLVFSPTAFSYLLPFEGMMIPQIMWSGAMFLVLGFCIAVAANFTLGDQWRSGIVQNDNHSLIKSGLYNISRNPGYIGVGVAQLGFFLALPSLFSLTCLLVGLFALRKQTLLEEQYLLNRYHQHYASYRELVPRWL